jgi:hypothetical protein
MIQRLKEFGGELRLQNAAPGTIVELAIPIDPLAASHGQSQSRPREAVGAGGGILAKSAEVPQKLF